LNFSSENEDEIYSESEEKECWYKANNINVKLETLKGELESQHNKMKANEYNKK